MSNRKLKFLTFLKLSRERVFPKSKNAQPCLIAVILISRSRVIRARILMFFHCIKIGRRWDGTGAKFTIILLWWFLWRAGSRATGWWGLLVWALRARGEAIRGAGSCARWWSVLFSGVHFLWDWKFELLDTFDLYHKRNWSELELHNKWRPFPFHSGNQHERIEMIE